MSTPGSAEDEPDSGYARLEQQLRWYDAKSMAAQQRYKYVKIAQFALGAAVPITATLNGVVTAVLGAAVIILEGLQQLNQWQQNWIAYRATCEALRHEKYLFLGHAGDYAGHDPEAARTMLVERVESLISTEHAKWTARQEKPKKDKPAGSPRTPE